jgi:hypothetical protein
MLTFLLLGIAFGLMDPGAIGSTTAVKGETARSTPFLKNTFCG